MTHNFYLVYFIFLQFKNKDPTFRYFTALLLLHCIAFTSLRSAEEALPSLCQVLRLCPRLWCRGCETQLSVLPPSIQLITTHSVLNI